MDKLFLIHLGYYDDIGSGIYESHTNFFMVASDFDNAKEKAKQLDIVKKKRKCTLMEFNLLKQ